MNRSFVAIIFTLTIMSLLSFSTLANESIIFQGTLNEQGDPCTIKSTTDDHSPWMRIIRFESPKMNITFPLTPFSEEDQYAPLAFGLFKKRKNEYTFDYGLGTFALGLFYEINLEPSTSQGFVINKKTFFGLANQKPITLKLELFTCM